MWPTGINIQDSSRRVNKTVSLLHDNDYHEAVLFFANFLGKAWSQVDHTCSLVIDCWAVQAENLAYYI